MYPALLEKYIKTGKVKFVYKHAAILGQESLWAGQAAECAADQQRFWEYHDMLFKRQNGENQGAYSKENLTGVASDLELDIKKFSDCLNIDRTLDRVQRDTAEGQRIGMRGTPHFLINGKAVVGAQPLEVFQTVIEQALQSKPS